MKYPDSKISHTVLEFGRELVLGLPEDHTREELEACMKIVVLVWNSVTLDTIQQSKENMSNVLEAMKDEPEEMVLIIKRLAMRKKRKFGSDLRGVGETWIKGRPGDFTFGCDARVIAEIEK